MSLRDSLQGKTAGEKRTFDRLRFEKVVNLRLDAIKRRHVLERLWQLLEYDSALEVRVGAFQGLALVSESTSNVHEYGLLGRGFPVTELLRQGENGEPRCRAALNRHYLLEVTETLGLAGKPLKGGKLGVESFLEGGVGGIVDVLVLDGEEEIWQSLVDGTTGIKTSISLGAAGMAWKGLN